MSSYQIEAYAYSEGPSNGLEACKYADAQTFGAVDAGGSWYSRPLVPMAFLDLIAYWAADLTASPINGNYAISYSDTTRRVTIATTNAVNFTPIFSANVQAFLGFSPQTFVPGQTFTGDLAPLGILTPIGLDLDLREDKPQIFQGDYRHGRTYPIVFGNFKTIAGVLYLRQDELHLKSSAYFGGRVRISTLAVGLATAYSVANLQGFFDAQLKDWQKPVPQSTAVATRIPIVLAVAR